MRKNTSQSISISKRLISWEEVKIINVRRNLREIDKKFTYEEGKRDLAIDFLARETGISDILGRDDEDAGPLIGLYYHEEFDLFQWAKKHPGKIEYDRIGGGGINLYRAKDWQIDELCEIAFKVKRYNEESDVWLIDDYNKFMDELKDLLLAEQREREYGIKMEVFQ